VGLLKARLGQQAVLALAGGAADDFSRSRRPLAPKWRAVMVSPAWSGSLDVVIRLVRDLENELVRQMS
jgi:hypothetical protein